MLKRDISIKSTTSEERKEIVDWSLSIASLSGNEVDAETKARFQEYVDGKIEISEIEHLIIKRFTEERETEKSKDNQSIPM